MKHFARLLVVLLIVTCAWRYGRESVRAWLGNATRAPLGPVASSVELPAGEHYSPAEDLERLDYQAIRSARRSVDIAMFSLRVMWTIGFLGGSAVKYHFVSIIPSRLDPASQTTLPSGGYGHVESSWQFLG